MTCYGTDMTKRRGPEQGTNTSQATGHREADALAQSMKDAPVRELLVAGGLRGFQPAELFKGAA